MEFAHKFCILLSQSNVNSPKNHTMSVQNYYNSIYRIIFKFLSELLNKKKELKRETLDVTINFALYVI